MDGWIDDKDDCMEIMLFKTQIYFLQVQENTAPARDRYIAILGNLSVSYEDKIASD